MEISWWSVSCKACHECVTFTCSLYKYHVHPQIPSVIGGKYRYCLCVCLDEHHVIMTLKYFIITAAVKLRACLCRMSSWSTRESSPGDFPSFSPGQKGNLGSSWSSADWLLVYILLLVLLFLWKCKQWFCIWFQWGAYLPSGNWLGVIATQRQLWGSNHLLDFSSFLVIFVFGLLIFEHFFFLNQALTSL